jgi:hypothetical protein
MSYLFPLVASNARECATCDVNRANVETLSYRQTLYHRFERNADGSAKRCRVNGKVKLWKKSPQAFRLPVKWGLKHCFYLTQQNGSGWSTIEPVYIP